MSAAREETRARPAVVVRRVGPEAAEQVMHVVHEAFSARPPLDPPPGALKETVHTIRGKLADGGGLLACIDDEPVGTLILDPIGSSTYIRRFGVVPGQQGLGGGALQMLGGELAAFKQLLLQITQVLPAEVDAHCGGQYPGRDQGHQQESGLDTNVVHVNVFPFPRQPCIQGRREIRTWVGQITSLSVS